METGLARVEIEIERLRCELGRLGVVVGDAMPRVGPRDSLRVARLKERLAALCHERSRVRAAGCRVDTVARCGAPRGQLH